MSSVLMAGRGEFSLFCGLLKRHSQADTPCFSSDNAIPIEGWISDPTDCDLLYLVPFLEALQHVTDVRALLALRQGQTQHM